MNNNDDFEINEVIGISYKNSEIFLGTIKKLNVSDKKTIYYTELPIASNFFNGVIYASGNNILDLRNKLENGLEILIKKKLQDLKYKTINIINKFSYLN